MSPRNPVLNRRNVATLRQHGLAATPRRGGRPEEDGRDTARLPGLPSQPGPARTHRPHPAVGEPTDAEYDAVVTRGLDNTPDKSDEPVRE
jgi:hypothetical protein